MMNIRSFVKGALLGALAIPCVSLPTNALAAPRVATLGAAEQNAMTRFNVYLPLTHTQDLEKLLSEQTNKTSTSYHQWLTPAQFKDRFGPSRADMAEAKLLLETAGFTVLGERTQNLEVEGPVSAVETMFATHLAAHVHSQVAKPLATFSPLTRLSSANSIFYPNANPVIYELSQQQTAAGGVNAPPQFQYFHRNISGNNNFYTVRPGQAYSEVLGNGTLNVENFLLLPVPGAPAGTPNTPSNP